MIADVRSLIEDGSYPAAALDVSLTQRARYERMCHRWFATAHDGPTVDTPLSEVDNFFAQDIQAIDHSEAAEILRSHLKRSGWKRIHITGISLQPRIPQF